MMFAYDYGARYYDPSIGRFTGVDPISDQFPHVSTYNYAENSPIRYIDLWGLQKAEPPMFRANAKAALTGGHTGGEINFFGVKIGGTVSAGGQDILGASIDYDDQNGGQLNGTYFDSTEEKFGVSGGKLAGGEISATFDSENPGLTTNVKLTLGLANLNFETTTDEEGNSSTNTYLGIEIGINGGFIYGFKLSGSAEMNITSQGSPDIPENNSTETARDNTTVILPVLENPIFK